MKTALGLIETIGMTTAAAALDAACKNADVSLTGCEKIIGAGKAISVTIQIAGQLAAVQSAVDAGVEAAQKVGTVLSAHVIPRPHEEMEKLMARFNRAYHVKLREKEEKKALHLE